MSHPAMVLTGFQAPGRGIPLAEREQREASGSAVLRSHAIMSLAPVGTL